jgi:p-aminobenzoyl-glutamate transporter AbgT
MLISGLIMAMGWVYLDLPLGGGAMMGYELPEVATP